MKGLLSVSNLTVSDEMNGSTLVDGLNTLWTATDAIMNSSTLVDGLNTLDKWSATDANEMNCANKENQWASKFNKN